MLLWCIAAVAILLIGTFVFAAMIAVPGLTTNIWIICAMMVLSGATIALWNVTVVSLRQEITPDHVLGRLNSAYRLLAWGSQPLGALLGGLVAGVVGLQWTFVIFGLGTLVTLVFLPAISNSRIAAAIEASGATSR